MHKLNKIKFHIHLHTTGDIHGQFDELRHIFEVGGMPANTKYLFLGDYVDRGPRQLETICLLLAFKVRYPQSFHMLRGNHEDSGTCSFFGFLDECMMRLSKEVFDTFVSVFECMPIAAIVERKMFCVHAGISPELHDLNQIRNIPRPIKVPASGLLCDLLWSDPDIATVTWQQNYRRGVSWLFGPQPIMDFLKKFNFEVIVRAHEVVAEGFQFFLGMHLVTIFSTSNGGINKAVVLHVDQNRHCTFLPIQQ